MNCVRILLIVLGCLLATASLGTAGDDKKPEKKRKPRFAIGKETTYVTEPLDADGFPDYVAALNQRMSKGVTPTNNANVLLWKAFGPHPEGAKMSAEFFQWMGIRQPPEKGDYFVGVRQFLKESDDKNEPPLEDVLEQVAQRPWTAKEHPDIATWLRANAKPLAVTIEATKRSHYYFPLVPARTKEGGSKGLMTSLVAGVQKCRDLSQALMIRAMLAIGEGRHDDAWHDLLACHCLARLVGTGGTLIELLVGVAVESMASAGDLVLLESAQLKSATIKSFLRDLQQLPPRSAMADKIDLCERLNFLETVTLLSRHGPAFLEALAGAPPGKSSNPFAQVGFDNIDWDPAMRNANRFYDRMAAALRIKERPAREKELELLDIEFKELKAKIMSKSPLEKMFFPLGISADARGRNLGNILIALLMPALRKVQAAADRIDQVENNLQLAFALAAYQREEGNYPATLDALAPKYLKEVPLDLFSGKPLIYQPSEKGYLLYSVGVNGKDEGGRSFDDDPPGDDLVVRMPLPALRNQP